MTSGSEWLAGWASEAVVVLVSRADNITAGEGRTAASSMRTVCQGGAW